MKPISKSKRQLAQLLIEAGVKQFQEGANWAAQDADDKTAYMHREKPNRPAGWSHFSWMTTIPGSGTQLQTLIPNWHQTVLSRDEFDQIVAETAPDADGWIKCSGDKLPVPYGTMIDVKYSDGDELHGAKCGVCTYSLTSIRGECASAESFEKGDDFVHIISYRLHKPDPAKSTTVGDDYANLAVKEELEALELTPTPTIDQLLQDWRNADDCAKRKQAEADEAAAMRDERWQAVQDRAGEMGVTISPCGAKQEADPGPDLVITDISELLEGDLIWVGDSGCASSCPEGEYYIDEINHEDQNQRVGVMHLGKKCWPQLRKRKWRFIRRP